jgi:hypothetical protein
VFFNLLFKSICLLSRFHLSHWQQRFFDFSLTTAILHYPLTSSMHLPNLIAAFQAIYDIYTTPDFIDFALGCNPRIIVFFVCGQLTMLTGSISTVL